jgi:porin
MKVKVQNQPSRRLSRGAATALRRSGACGLLGAMCAGAAWGQVIAGTSDNATAPVTAATSLPVNKAEPGILSGLADHGLYFRLLYNQEVAGNPSGGIKQGATTSQYLAGGVDLDMEKAFGWTGGKLHATMIGIKSKSLTTYYIGGGTSAQENSAPFTLLRFLELTYDQNFTIRNKNDFNFTIGRLSAFQTFAKSPFSTLFQNHAHSGALYGFSQSSGTALAPVSTWGGKVTYRPTAKTYVHAGSFAIDAAVTNSATHLWDFGTKSVSGQNYMLETGYETDFSNDAMPRRIRLGAWYLDAPRNDVYLNTKGQSFTQFGGTRQTYRHDRGMYVMGDQTISRPDPNSKRNVAVFGSFLYNHGNFEPLQYTAKLGIVKTGTFAGRDADTLGLVMSDLSFSNKQVKFLSERRAKGGGTGTVPSHGYVIEAAYSYALAPGVTIAPNIQYLVNPDSRVTPNHPTDIPDALVLGVRFMANFGALFNFPRGQ